jgi:hypothetical protein
MSSPTTPNTPNPSSIIEIPDSGIVTVKIGTDSFNLDAYDVHNRICSIRSKIVEEDRPREDFHAEIGELLKGKGLPTLNCFQVDRLTTKLAVAVDELGKT